MMKWLLLALLLVNGVAYFWLSSAQEQRLAREQRPPGVYTRDQHALALVSETRLGSQGVSSASQDCVLLGSISNKAKVSELAAVMAVGGVVALPRELVESSAPGYWVYIAAPEAEAELASLRNKLKLAEIDNFVFREGEMKGGVSLGFFSSYKNAVNQQDDLKKLGFTPDIVSVSSVNRSYWLEISKKAEARVQEKFWPALVLASLAGEVERRACEGGESRAKNID